MKVLFSNPPWWIENQDAIYTPKILAGVRAGSRWPFTTPVRSRPGHYQFGDYLPYPFFLGAAATYLARETGAQVTFRDSLALREGYDAYFNFLQEQNFDSIVLESASPSWAHDARLIRQIKAQNPRSKIVVTGPIAAMGEKLLLEHPVDAVIQGEYEKGCVKVVNGAEGLLHHDLLTEAELNAAPYPYQDEVYAHRYWDSNPKGQRPPQAQVLSSRGCPFKCIFCVWPAVMTNNDPDGQGVRRVRQYTADYMEGLLTDLVGRFDYQTIYFDDDTFNLGDRHVKAMCEVMQRIGLPWSAMCRADTIARDTWKLMRDSGCFGVKIGFESGNQWVVDNIVHKSLDLERARDVVLYLKDLGFAIHGTFTVGLPGETPEQMADTERYRQSLPLDSFQQSGTAEIEGSPLATLRKTGRLEKYAGASLEGYLGETDGTRKLWHVALRGMSLDDAIAARAKGNPALAEAICCNLLEAGGESAPVLNLLGALAKEGRQLTLAVRFCIRAIRADPSCCDACVNLGDILREQGLLEESASCYRHALRVAPACVEARRGLECLEAMPRPAVASTPSEKAGLIEELSEMAGTAWGRSLKLELQVMEEARKAAATAETTATAREGAGMPVHSEHVSEQLPSPAPHDTPDTTAQPPYPRIIVLDHGMRYVPGHHLAYNLGLLTECKKRGIEIEFYVHADCRPEAAEVLKAKRLLKPSPYNVTSHDKYCGFLEDFNISSKIAEFNLFRTLQGKVDPSDIVYIHTADPKIVMGVASWYLSLAKEKRPYICIKFQNHGYRYVVKEYKALVQSAFRLALKPFKAMEKAFFAASNKMIAMQIRLMAEKPCPVFPIPLQLNVAPKIYRSRSEKKTLCIGYAGEGRHEQGVNMLPDIIEETLARYPDLIFVIQIGCRFAEDATLARLRSFGENVMFLDRCFVGSEFHHLIGSFDALLLPYAANKYIERSSQVVIEAIALGVPLIVQARTSMAIEAKEFDCGYTLIQQHEPHSVVEAIEDFVEDHDALAQKSAVAAGKCAAFHSGKNLVDMLLHLREQVPAAQLAGV
jgi:glycosyltransferase involved in cell wall biosynthesis